VYLASGEFSAIRMDVRVEQRVNIKFGVKLAKTATETLQLLHGAYVGEALSRARVFACHRRFILSKVSAEDDTRSGRPSSLRNENNVVRISDMIKEDRTVTVRVLADALHINKSTCHQILQDLGKRKLNARLVPHALTQDQKEVRASNCADLLHEAQNDAMFVNSMIAEDESWCFQYDPQTKRQSAEWRSMCTPPSKKVRRQSSKTKTIILFFFFDARGIVHHKFVPQWQKINQEVYISFLRRMHEAIQRRRSDLCASGRWNLLHDNARPHTALSV